MSQTLIAPSRLRDRQESALRRRLESEMSLARLFQKIDGIQELNGARIVYVDTKMTAVVLRDFQPGCHEFPVTLFFREAPDSMTPDQYAATLKKDARESQMVGEVIGTTLSCGAAVLSWLVIIGSSTAIPFTGGTSTAVVYLSYASAVAGTAQCLNGFARTGLEAYAPETKDWLDSQAWYTNTALAVDAISLAGAGASSVAVGKTLQLLKTSPNKTTREVLKGLSRAERKRLTQEIIKLNHPAVSAKAMKALIGAGKYPQRYTQGQISEALALKVKDALAASMTFTGSAISGLVKTLAVGVYEKTGEI